MSPRARSASRQGAARRARAAPLLLLLASLACADDASACKCAERSVDAYYATARHVFLARIVDLQRTRDDGARDGARTFAVSGGFRIDETFKGNPSRPARIGTGQRGGDCGIRLESGHRYVFFVDASGGAWACSGSREILRGDIDDARLLIRLRTLALGRPRGADSTDRRQESPRR